MNESLSNPFNRRSQNLHLILQTTDRTPQTINRTLQTINRMPQTINRMPQPTSRMPQTINRMPQPTSRMPQTTSRMPHILDPFAHTRQHPRLGIYSVAAPSKLLFHVSPESNRTPGINFEVRHKLAAMEALIGCFVCMSFSWSVVEFLRDGIALLLG